jgi:hypothetical protein
MALSNRFQCPRGTRAALDTLAGASGLKAGEIYLITDENRIAVGITTNTYQTLEKQSASTFVFVLGDGNTALAAGATLDLPDLPYAGTITGWTILSDAAGSCVATISKCTYANFPTFTAISGTEKPTLTSAQKNQDLSLTTWTTSFAQGDILRCSLDSASTVKRVQIGLRVLLT